MNKQGSMLRDQVIAVAGDYLGPAAPRFIDRLIANHLAKQPGDLSDKDLPELIRWTRLATAMLTDDPKEINDFVQRLRQLR